MPDPYERYLADLASADGMPEAPADPDAASPAPLTGVDSEAAPEG